MMSSAINDNINILDFLSITTWSKADHLVEDKCLNSTKERLTA